MNEVKLKEREEELDKNFEAFQKLLPELVEESLGKFVLFHEGELINIYDTAHDAYAAGQDQYGDKPFSVQRVSLGSVDLGVFSHAVPYR